MSDKQRQQGAVVGLCSRLDKGGNRYRAGLVIAGFEIFRQYNTNFNLLIGGLIDKEGFIAARKAYVDELFSRDKKVDKAYPRFKNLTAAQQTNARKLELEEAFLNKVVTQLKNEIPVQYGPDPEDPQKQKLVDLFIVTSHTFDGDIGQEVALRLADRRSDIRVWNENGDRFNVKYVDKVIHALTAEFGIWMRSKYVSNPPERIIDDKINQTSQDPPDSYVVGGFGSSVNKPCGELDYSYVTIPVLHRLQKVKVNENQIGVGILNYPEDGGPYSYAVFSLKDLVNKELSFVGPPEQARPLQRAMVSIIKERSQATPGDLRYYLEKHGFNVSNDEVERSMQALMAMDPVNNKKGESWPGVWFDEQARKYRLHLPWIQEKLRYPLPNKAALCEDVIYSICCMHAGSVETDLEHLLRKVPQEILQCGATIFVNAGDTKEGLAHDLYITGQVIPGMNDTVQEQFAAFIIGEIMTTVFKSRFQAALASQDPATVKAQRIFEIIEDSLLLYVYILGNHDLWEAKQGHTPLVLFHKDLVLNLTESIFQFLCGLGVSCSFHEILQITRSKVQRTEQFKLASGLEVLIQHPHMPRAKTTSIRPQEMLDFAKRQGCQVAIGGNFHVAETLALWDMNLGQCVVQQVGTMKHGSDFERHKMKTVDHGGAMLRITSSKNELGQARIYSVESTYFPAPQKDPIKSLSVVNPFLNGLGLPSIEF